MSFESPPIVMQVLVLVIVGIAAMYDVRYRRIPNWLAVTGIAFGMSLNIFLFGWRGLRLSLLGFGLAFAIYFPLYLLHGMGAGDVKLMTSVGAIVGWADWLGIFIFTAIVGGVAAIVLLLIRSRLRRGLSNVGYLLRELLSFRAPHARNEELDVGSSKSMKLPHGVVIACGCGMFLGAAWTFAPR
jgi:prepilin peptidase CpaA